jgi:hypothetical protein
VGDLVTARYRDDLYDLGLGIVLGFDEEGDPLIHFQFAKNPRLGGVLYYAHNVRVVK